MLNIIFKAVYILDLKKNFFNNYLCIYIYLYLNEKDILHDIYS